MRYSTGINIHDKNVIFRHYKDITKAYETYFRFGGLPELTVVADKRAWLSNLYQKILLGDLVTRYKVRNAFALQVLIRKLAGSVKRPTSFNRLANVVSSSGKKISTDTVIDYLGYLQESWLIFSFENMAAKLADKVSNKKYYFSDNGLLNLFLIDPLTSLLENQVPIQLHKLSKQIAVDRMLIITKDEEATIREHELIIEVVPVWKWLLHAHDHQ